MNFNHESIGVLKFHYVSKQFNIRDWEVYYNDESIKGEGFGALLKFCETLPQDKTTVIYCKGVKLLYILNKNGNWFEFGDGRLTSSGPSNFDFFTLKTKDETIEFREWDNWFKDIETCKEFYQSFYCTMDYLKCYDVEKFGLYTLSNDCFRKGIIYRYDDFIGYDFKTAMAPIIKRAIPKDESILDFYENYWRGGMAFYNPFIKDKVYNNISSFDKKSCHLAAMIFEKFPLTDFEEVEPKYWKDVQDDFEDTAFIADLYFDGLRPKNSSILPDLRWRFGMTNSEDVWFIRINEVDWKWFKNEYEWNKAYISKLWVAQKTYLPKGVVKSLLKLYEEKESYEKGDIRRTLAKQCTELPYGQSIKRLFYEYDAKIEEGEVVITKNPEPSFEEKQEILAKRRLPLQLGIWTVSYSRLDIWKASNIVGLDHTFYTDTDCIKTDKKQEIQVYLNKEIEEKARLAQERYPSIEIPKNLGRWDYEYKADEFIVAGLKWYAFSSNGTIKFKAAGAQLDILKNWFRNNSIDKFNTKLEVDQLFKTIKYDLTKNYAIISYNNFFNEYIGSEQELYESEVKL